MVRREADFPPLGTASSHVHSPNDMALGKPPPYFASFLQDDQLATEAVPSFTSILLPLSPFPLLLIAIILLTVGLYLFEELMPLPTLLPALISVVLYVIRILWITNTVYEERMIVMRDVGIQMVTRYWGGKETFSFVETNKIQAMVINEGFHQMSVIAYLAFILEDGNEMALGFKHLFPPMHSLVQIYRASRALMFGEPDVCEDKNRFGMRATSSTPLRGSGDMSSGEKRALADEAMGRRSHQRTGSIGLAASASGSASSSSKRKSRRHKRLQSNVF